MTAAVRLGANQYGKAEVRIVKVTRTTPVHEIEDLNVTSQLRGDFSATHLTGDNALVVATDTQKNTIYGLAREHGIGSPEDFLLVLGRHFTGSFDWVTGGRWAAEAYRWERIAGARPRVRPQRAGDAHRGARLGRRAGADQRLDRPGGAQVHRLGVPRLPAGPVHDAQGGRATASWRRRSRPSGPTRPWSWTSTRSTATIRAALLQTFADTHSLALQQTLYAMGTAVIEAVDAVSHIRIAMPNKHHFLVDLEPFGLDNPNEIFFPADRPYGLIEATVERAV